MLEKSNENKCLTLVSADESKNIVRKYGELWFSARDINRSNASSSDNYHEKYMKIKFKLDDDLPLLKTLELQNMLTFVRSIFS